MLYDIGVCGITYKGRGADLQIMLAIIFDKFEHGFDDFKDVNDEHCKDDQDNEDDEGA